MEIKEVKSTGWIKALVYLYLSLLVHFYLIWFFGYAEEKGLLNSLSVISKTQQTKKEPVIENIIVDTKTLSDKIPDEGKISDKPNLDSGRLSDQKYYNYFNPNPKENFAPKPFAPAVEKPAKDGEAAQSPKQQEKLDSGDSHTTFFDQLLPADVQMNNAGDISLGTIPTEFAGYFLDMQKRIGSNWELFFPIFQHYQGMIKDGTVTVRFEIDPNGNLVNIQLVQSYGYDVLDQSCVNAVRYTRNAGVPPEGLKKLGKISVSFKFQYIRKK